MEYKISKESAEKVQPTKFKGYVELTDADLLDAKISLEDLIWDAHKTALHNGIRANTVMINKRLAKTSAFVQSFGGGVMDIPPMICGLEAYVTDEIPNEFAFCLAEAPETKSEKIRAAERRLGYEQGVKEMQERLTSYFRKYNEVDDDFVNESIDQIAKEMLESGDG
jgi:hypothetical protein